MSAKVIRYSLAIVTAVVALATWGSGLVACGSSGTSGGATPGSDGGSSGTFGDSGATNCAKGKTCAELGWACGYSVDACGDVTNCADEGRACTANQVCKGGIAGAPTTCVDGTGGTCDVCAAIPNCTGKPQLTRLTGRVVTPGRDDANTGNQVGVPNAIVYIPQSSDPAALPPVPSGIPNGASSCDLCTNQDLGRVLAGAVTDPTGVFTMEGNIPVGKEFLLVVKVGRFRRALKQTLSPDAGCTTTTLPPALPTNPTRLPRSTTDGLAVNIPHIAVTTGQIDAMECVFEKMGIAHTEFGNGAAATGSPRVHLYQGGLSGAPQGATIDGNTPFDTAIYGDPARIETYDMVVADCEGKSWDKDFSQRDANGGKVMDYVNRGGRLFTSHLSFSWLHENGTQLYSAATPFATGLGPASTWVTNPIDSDTATGTGEISLGADRPRKSPRIQNFADWMTREGVVIAPPPLTFDISQPRSQADVLGTSSEEFVFLTTGTLRVQQFSFNAPYAAPDTAACGRVAHSGFHVAAAPGGGDAPYGTAIFPAHCIGDLTNQEKVLLYMLFDVSSCVGLTPPPPTCTPSTCVELGATCGFAPDGCGKVLDCGACNPK